MFSLTQRVCWLSQLSGEMKWLHYEPIKGADSVNQVVSVEIHVETGTGPFHCLNVRFYQLVTLKTIALYALQVDLQKGEDNHQL